MATKYPMQSKAELCLMLEDARKDASETETAYRKILARWQAIASLPKPSSSELEELEDLWYQHYRVVQHLPYARDYVATLEKLME